MKKDGINIMLVGLVITIITAILYFSKMNEPFMNKFVLGSGSSFHFNWAPMIGILIMAFGEFLLWESQNNVDLIAVKAKFRLKFMSKLSNVRLGMIYFFHMHLINFNALRQMIMSFKL
ncbi:MAG: hypothetical protein PHT07_07810 [Paludibacter sp.]|nr:hypothetical protein [Paludibacter sp.]